MYLTVLILHIVVCFSLILIVLLQSSKGSDMGSAFGGGSSQTVFGASGPQSFLGKLTTASAVIFMVTSLFLAAISSRNVSTSVIPDQAAVTEVTEETEATQPTADTSNKSESDSEEPTAE